MDCGDGIIGKVRWPGACGVCGPVRVTEVTVDGDTGEAVLTLAAGTAFHDGDTVVVAGVDAEINGSQTVTVLAANELRINGSDGSAITYTSGGTVDAPNQVDQYWNESPPDNWRKGKFTVKQWDLVFRDFMESVSFIFNKAFRDQEISEGSTCPAMAAVLPVRFTVCAGANVLTDNYICGPGSLWLKAFEDRACGIVHTAEHPNYVYVGPVLSPAEQAVWPANTVFVFFPDLDLDEQYGSMRLGRIDQWMTDPLWQAYGRNWQGLRCSDATVLLQDDGCSIPDDAEASTRYYPFPDQEESRAAAPAGSPALPAGTEIGCPDFLGRLNGLVSGTPAGACYPPYSFAFDLVRGAGAHCIEGYRFFGEPVDRSLPWIVQANQERGAGLTPGDDACTFTDGRFTDDYKANGLHLP